MFVYIVLLNNFEYDKKIFFLPKLIMDHKKKRKHASRSESEEDIRMERRYKTRFLYMSWCSFISCVAQRSA